MLSSAARRHGGRVAGTKMWLPFRGAKSVGLYGKRLSRLVNTPCSNSSTITPVDSARPASVLFLSTSSRNGSGQETSSEAPLDVQRDETATFDHNDGSNKRLSTVIQDLGMKESSSRKHHANQDGDDDNNNNHETIEPPARHPRYHATPQMSRFGSLYHPLKAFHIARTIDLVQVMNMLNDSLGGGGGGNASSSLTTIKKKFFGKNSLVIQLPSPPTMMPHNLKSNNNNNDTNNDPPHIIMPQVTRYMAVFRFGSVVFLNVSPRQVANLVQEIKTKCSMEPVASGLEKRENFGVMVSPSMMLAQQRFGLIARQQQQQQRSSPQHRPQHQHQQRGRPAQGAASSSKTTTTTLHQQQHGSEQQLPTVEEEPDVVVTGDYCIVPDLDLNRVAVISNILAQTVAMDSYNEKVDEMLNQFEAINSTVKDTGSLPNTEKTFLFKTVAKNNAIFIDMIRKIKLKDRSETAWTITKHESIHYALKAEFEIDDRFDQIDFKLNLIQQNAKFFLEVLQSQKSNSLEWVIVILIALECCIMCIDMSGMGPGLYEYISSWISWPTTTITTTTPTPPTIPTPPPPSA